MPSPNRERLHAALRRNGSPLWASGLALIVLVTLARLAYLAWFSPYTLIEDEAHYWEWSRRLELSYYSKGPGIAWVIRAATELLGTSEWTIRLPAVVSSAVGAFCVAGLARDVCNHPSRRPPNPTHQEHGRSSPIQQGDELSSPQPQSDERSNPQPQGGGHSSPIQQGDGRSSPIQQGDGLSSPIHKGGGLSSPRQNAGLYAATIYLAMPAFWVLGIIITIDGPYLASWAAACWAAWRALTTNAPRAWAALGLALALGFLFKYTILLLLPGLALAAWLARHDTQSPIANRARSASEEPSPEIPTDTASPKHFGSSRALRARWRLRPGPLLAIAIASLGLLPVVLWNIQHDWITVKHLLGHLGVKGGDITPAPDESWSPFWSLELLGIQLGLAGPAILLAIYAFVCARRERNEHPDLWRAARFLACCGLPILGFYLLVSLIAEPEGNWPLAAWVSAAPLGAIGVVRVFPEYRRRVAAWRQSGSPGLRPHMHRVMMWRWTVGLGIIVALGFARADWLARLPILGPLVPQGRLMFADVRAADATRILDGLRTETGLEPVVMAQHYGRTSQLAYYLPGRPTVYCAGAFMDGPKKQYDLWPETNLANPQTHARLAGRPALLVGGRFEQWVPAFARVVEIGQLESEHKKGRLIYLGYNYQGFPETTRETIPKQTGHTPRPSTPGGRAFQPAISGGWAFQPAISGGWAFQPATEPHTGTMKGVMLVRQRKYDAPPPAGSSLALRARFALRARGTGGRP